MVKDCNEYDKGCKYFHHEPYYTPNNYDVFFDYNSIPVNIPVEKPHDFRNRLQKLMPLTKIIHLNMDNETLEEDNAIHLHTKLKLNYNSQEDSTQTILKVTGQWNDLDEANKGNVTCKISYLYDEETPVVNARIRVINVHYPVLQYSGTTNDEGECSFEDLPYGSYVEQILIDGYTIPLHLFDVDEGNIEDKLLIGASEEITDETVDDENTNVQLNFYRNGILILSSWSYDNGKAITADEDEFEDGILNLNVTSDDFDDSTTILLNSPGFEVINDFTEFEVDIIADNTVVDTVTLNFRNNYSKSSKILPLHDENNEKIDYYLGYSQENCDVTFEYSDLVNYKNNERVLL